MSFYINNYFAKRKNAKNDLGGILRDRLFEKCTATFMQLLAFETSSLFFLCFEPWLALLSLIFGLLATQDIVFLKDDAYEAEILLSSVIDYYSQ